MKTNSYFYWKILPSLLVIFVMLCASCAPSPAPETSEPQQPEVTETQVEVESTASPEMTATEPQQVTSEPATDVPTVASNTGPRCTVVQDLNVRSGPGTAYDPPIDALLANSEVLPIAYNPVGYPGGAWVQVKNLEGKTKGWVSAGSDYVSCNIDLTTLPSVNVAPPPTVTPPPNRPSAQTSNPTGDCGQGGTYDCEVVLSEGVPIQFIVTKDGQVIGGAEGLESVEFEVRQADGTTIYSHTEKTSAYCMFGGDSPCSSWVWEDNVYKWGSGGAVVQAGEYPVRIQARFTVNTGASDLRWFAIITVQ